MWIALLLALLAYLASPKGNDAERRRALLTAAGVGGAAYIATVNTDWGRDISRDFDNAIGVGGTPGTADDAANQPSVKKPDGKPSSGTGSFGSWIPAIVGGGVGGAIAGGSNGIPSWLIWGGLLVGGYLILKN